MTTDLRSAPLQLVRKEDGAAIDLDPLQGLWTAEQYLKLTDFTRYLVEFTDGVIEVRGRRVQVLDPTRLQAAASGCEADPRESTRRSRG